MEKTSFNGQAGDEKTMNESCENFDSFSSMNIYASFTEEDDAVDYEQLEYLQESLLSRKSICAERKPQLHDNFDYNKRFTFYSQDNELFQSDTFFNLLTGKNSVSHIMKEHPFWLDIACPTSLDMKIISRIFNIHPLTLEDIQTKDTREKCDRFDRYLFICLNLDSELGEDRNLYAVVFPDYILTVHYSFEKCTRNILKKLSQLQISIEMSTEWIMYCVIDEITDTYMPVIDSMETEAEIIDDLVLVLTEKEQSDLLVRIGSARKKVTMLQRLLKPKSDILKTLTKKCGDRISSQCILYLRDIEDHIIQMSLDLEHYSEILNRSHSNYLAQISIEITQVSNKMGKLMQKFTAAASVLLPLQLISGMWGMNVNVPGQQGITLDDCIFFYIICGSMLIMTMALLFIAKRYQWF